MFGSADLISSALWRRGDDGGDISMPRIIAPSGEFADVGRPLVQEMNIMTA